MVPYFVLSVAITTAGLSADGLLCSVLGLYLFGVRRLARRGCSWPWAGSLTFGLGLFSVFVAVGSGLPAYVARDMGFVLSIAGALLLTSAARPI